MRENPCLAFQIVNDLLLADVIRGDVSGNDIQILVQARLNLSCRHKGKKVIHFQHNKAKSQPICNQIGSVQVTSDTSKVTCLRCLQMYQVHGSYERW